MQQQRQIRKRQGTTLERHELNVLPEALPYSAPGIRLVLAEAGQVWIKARGESMWPTWADGARLLVKPAKLHQILPGDLIVYESSGFLIAHRLLHRSAHAQRFQTKADASCAADVWMPAAALVGKVLAGEDGSGTVELASGRAWFWNRLLGASERLHVLAHACTAWFSRAAPRLEFEAGGDEGNPIAPLDDHAQSSLIWARNQVLRAHLEHAVRLLSEIGVQPITLKGQALLAADIVADDQRAMGDIDLLIPRQSRAAVLGRLDQAGWQLQAPQASARAMLDDQITLRDPEGVLFDIHWNIVTGGWRFRDVIRPDLDGMCWRAQHAGNILILEDGDQLLHLCMHLVLSGATGLKGWNDLRAFLAARAPQLDWNTVAERAGRWRVRGIVWLALDTLWQRWRIRPPQPLLRAARPSPWRRVCLRLLLPQDLKEDLHEPRFKRHLREWLLMDRWQDRFYLLGRWAFPPRAWFSFRSSQ